MRITFIITLFIIACNQVPSNELSESDLDAIKELRIKFQQAWLNNDSSAVMSILAEDIVFMPHHGAPIIMGRNNLAEFWFPPDSPPTTVSHFSCEFYGVEGSGNVGFS